MDQHTEKFPLPISMYCIQATVRRQHSYVMQSNTVTILRQMNYEPVEAHLLSYHIISYDDRKDLTNKTCKDQKLYIIEKVIKGTEEMFHNFLKALEECEDDSNHELMVHLRQDKAKEEPQPLCQSETLNTPFGSPIDELVLGEMSLPAQSSLKRRCSRSETSVPSKHPLHNGLPNQYKTKMEKLTLSTETLHCQRPSMPMNAVSDTLELSSDSWVDVCPQTNITYYKNLTLVMEYICDKVIESLTGTNCVQSTFTPLHNVKISIDLPKEVYLAADPKTITPATRAADEQIKQPYKDLVKILQKLQGTSYPRININLDPVLKRIHYSPNKIMVTEYSIDYLIQAVKKLNQATTSKPCVIL